MRKQSSRLFPQTNSVVARFCVRAGLFIVLLAIPTSPGAWAEERYCRIDPPDIQRQEASLTLTVNLACRDSAGEDFLRYPPNGPIYIGASLFGINNDGNDESISDDAGGHPVPFEVLDEIADGASVTLRLAETPREASHFVIAAWTQKMACVYCEEPVGFGPVDEDLFPMPLDSYPRPRCDLEALDTIGYFDWTYQGDPSGYTAPAEIQEAFDKVDCYRVNFTRPGLGLSLKSWRVAPLATN